ncbi:hypothetical protein [Paenibacillus sp. IHBB 3054]|uniref:hypothetical protein n=1 Tax=Paenibacillus sp. IHBB 3054 TaxID=3425689 RepID=UPI003F676C60
MDQSLLDGLGIGIAFVSLASLLKHGLYKAADKIANRKNIAALDDALEALTNEADIATRLKTNLPQEMVVKDGGLMDDLAKSKSLAGADDARTVGKPKAEGSSRSVEGTGEVTKTKKTAPPPYDREKILRNIEESKKAREASNFDKYLQKEKELLEKLNKGTGEAPPIKPIEPRGEPNVFIPAFKGKKIAINIYNRMRLTGLDKKELETISKNTGLSLDEVTAMKKHLFLTKHANLVDENGKYYYEGYFTPDN